MSDYRMDIKGSMELSDYSNIYDYLNIVDKDDKFTITIDNNNNDFNIDIINSMLIDSSFNIDSQGFDKEGKYCIKALKK